MISFIDEPDGFSAGLRVHGFFDVIYWFKDDLRGNPELGPEVVFDLFLVRFGGLAASDMDHDLIGSDGIGINLDIIIDHMFHIIEDIIEGWRVERGSLIFDHLLFPSEDRAEPHGSSAAATGFGIMIANIAGFKTQQRHAFHAEGGDGHFTGFMLSDGLIVIIQELHYDEFGMVMTSAAMAAFGESRSHLRRRVGGIELNVPFFSDPAAEGSQGEVGIPERFADTDCLFNAGRAVIDAVFFGIFDEFEDERRDGDEGVGFKPPDGVPLQFGHAVTHADDAGSEFPHPQEVGQAGHETPVDGGHELVCVVRGTVGYSEGNSFIIGQPLQVLIGHGEGHRLAQCSGRGNIVDDLVFRDADEIFIVALQVVLGRNWNFGKAFQCFNFGDVDTVFKEMLLVEFRFFLKESELFRQFLFLEEFYFRRWTEFDIWSHFAIFFDSTRMPRILRIYADQN